MRALFASLLLLAACQSSPEDERGRTVTVRMGAGSDVIAERECGGPARPVQTLPGTSQIVYLCVEESR